MELLSRIPGGKLPKTLILENVAGFTHSAAREKLLRILSDRGYACRERLLCPTELGTPSRRPRYYLTASNLPFKPEEPSSSRKLRPLADYLDAMDGVTLLPELQLPDDIVARFGKGLRILDPGAPSVCTTCFTSGYGRSIVNAGSYLLCEGRVRYFSPDEIARLLHFPGSFRFPDSINLRKRWHLAGNSLSVIAVQEILRSLPGVAETRPQATRTAP
jgi:site-specific DNA-cytosine methylase